MDNLLQLAKTMELGNIAAPYQRHDEDFVRIPLANGTDKKFDPFTDANDDCAVLKWAKTKGSGFMAQFMSDGLWDKRLPEYKVGDFARAALACVHDGQEQ